MDGGLSLRSAPLVGGSGAWSLLDELKPDLRGKNESLSNQKSDVDILVCIYLPEQTRVSGV